VHRPRRAGDTPFAERDCGARCNTLIPMHGRQIAGRSRDMSAAR
jgi:hypothetical protein